MKNDHEAIVDAIEALTVQVTEVAIAIRETQDIKKSLAEILHRLGRMEERQVRDMATVKEQLDAIQVALDSAGVALESGSTSLQNIAADEAAQTKMILDLQAQIAAGGSVTAESLQPLVDSATRQQSASQALAD